MRDNEKLPVTGLRKPASMQPPVLVDITYRQRVFDLINVAARRPCVWLTASAGYGKTTSLASYVENKQQTCIWYSLTNADSDPVRFFQSLSSGLKSQFPQLDLPEISLINLADPVAFSHAFFSTLKELNINIILDDYHQLVHDSLVHLILSSGIEMLKSGSLLIGSREPPPSLFTRLLANSVIECLVAENLRFTMEETNDLLSHRGLKNISTDQTDQLQKLSEGWAAGLVLLLNQQKLGPLPQPSEGLVFDYFMQEILSGYDQEARQFLVSVALLPEFTPDMANTLTGVKTAEALLDSASRSLSFIQRSGQNPPVYRFHALFRDVLLDIGKTEINKDTFDQLKHQAAEILADNDQLDAAINLLIELGKWEQLVGLILGNAESLLIQGRAITLKHWLHQIPEPVAAQITWVSFWDGMCDLPITPRETRKFLGTVLERFKQEEDPLGIYLTWSFIVESFWIERNEMDPLEKWYNEFNQISDQFPVPEIPFVKARVLYGQFLTLLLKPSRLDIDQLNVVIQ